MLTPLKNEMLSSGDLASGDLAHEFRRFRAILRSFERNLELLFKGTAVVTEVDHAALATAFANWRQRFDESKYLANSNRHDFVIFAAGLMLKELVEAKPLKAVTRAVPDAVPALANHALGRWPEGYAYTSFCLSVAGAILREMGEEEPDPAEASDDPAFWDSFRENVNDSPANAVAFFDMVCGSDPNWDAPDVPWLRKPLKARRALLD
jgi:hypothetical protein